MSCATQVYQCIRPAHRYAELSNEGKGPDVAYTGMSWTGFTPADDRVQYGYHIPSNMYAVGALER